MKKARYACALLLGLVCATARSQDAAWLAGVTALKNGEPAAAEVALSSWLSQLEAEGVHSREAHYNLGLALWNQKKSGRAVYHWATSATLQPNPIAAWRSLALLSRVEHEIGVQEAVSESWAFRMWVLITGNWILALAALGAWSLAGCGWLAWLQGRRAYKAARLLTSIPISLFLVALAGMLVRAGSSEFGVLDGEKNISVFRSAEERAENKLVELPSGTIVQSIGIDRTFVRISEPVAGWVPSQSFQAIRQH